MRMRPTTEEAFPSYANRTSSTTSHTCTCVCHRPCSCKTPMKWRRSVPNNCAIATMQNLALHLVPQALHFTTPRRLVHCSWCFLVLRLHLERRRKPICTCTSAMRTSNPPLAHFHLHGLRLASMSTRVTLPRLAFLHQPHSLRRASSPSLVAAQVSKRLAFVDVDVRRP